MISEQSYAVAQMGDGGNFHWCCSSWLVRSEYVFWKLEPTGTNWNQWTRHGEKGETGRSQE